MHLFRIKTTCAGEKDNEAKIYPQAFDYKYTEVISEIGFGKYQYKIVATVAVLYVSLGLYITMLSFLIPFYKKDIFINEWEVGILISTQGVGSLLGGVVFSYISDNYGRKFSLIIALTTAITTSIVSSFLNTFYPFLLLRSITSLGYGGIAPVGVTYLTEYLPDNRRGFFIVGLDVFRGIGSTMVVLASKVSSEEWRLFVLTPVPLFLLGLIVIIFFLPESSRYLLYSNNIEKLIKNLNEMCRQNGRPMEIRYSNRDEDDDKHASNLMGSKIYYDVLWKKWSTTMPLIGLWFFPAFGTGVLVFLPEILLQRGYSMNEIYMIFGFLSFIPVFGYIVSSIFIDTFGRRQVLSICSLIAGLSLMTFIVFNDQAIKLSVLYVVLGTYIIFMKVLKSVTTTYTPELYSTSTRTSALGLMNGADRAASILQPMIFSSIVYTSLTLAMAGYGAWYLIGFVCSLTLTKETANKPLKESLLSEVSDLDAGVGSFKHSLSTDN